MLGLGGSDLLLQGGLLLVVCGTLGLAALLESLDDLEMLVADLVTETADRSVFATGLQAQDAEGSGNDDALFVVVGRGDTLENLKTVQRSLAAGGLVADHAADSLVEDAAGGAEVEGASGLVEAGGLAQVGVVFELVAEELARDVEVLATHNSDVLAVENFLGHDGSETTEEVVLAVNDNLLLKGTHG